MSDSAALRLPLPPARRVPQLGLGMGGIAVAIIALYALAAVAAPLVAPADPYAYVARPFQPPSPTHPLGTNDVGQDVLSELVYGARASLLVAVLAGASAVAVGVLVGLLAGGAGGWADFAVMRAVDVFMTLPRLPVMIVIASYLGGNLANVIAVIVLFAWPATARVIRAQALSLRSLAYVSAARSFGAGTLHIMRRHLLPAVAPIVAAAFVANAGRAVLIESGLAFLGLGDPTVKSWGSMISFALRDQAVYFTGRWAWSVLPAALALSGLLMALALVGIALEARLDRRLGGGE